MDERGLSPTEFAAKIGKHPSYVSQLRSGEIGFSADSLNLYSSILECSPGELLEQCPEDFKDLMLNPPTDEELEQAREMVGPIIEFIRSGLREMFRGGETYGKEDLESPRKQLPSDLKMDAKKILDKIPSATKGRARFTVSIEEKTFEDFKKIIGDRPVSAVVELMIRDFIESAKKPAK